MSAGNESKGVDRRLLLMSAWTVPVVASFALGGVATAGQKIWGGGVNASIGGNMMSRTANGDRGVRAKAAPTPK